MSQVGQRRTAFRLLAVTVALMALTRPLSAQIPQPGQVQRLSVISLSLQVASTEKETRQVTYSPPPGWYVRSHRVECTRKSGNTSYTVTTVPQAWEWASEEKIDESYRMLIDLAARAENHGLQARFAHEREQKLLELRKVRATHHALIVDATVRGEGFLRARGGLDLVVIAELVYVGTDDDLERTIAEHKAALSK